MLCTGIDLVEIHRIRRAVERWGVRFLRRVFTPGEMADCGVAPDMTDATVLNYSSLAARWAAKEAAAKALGVGLRGLSGQRVDAAEVLTQRVAWTEVEVVRGSRGRPMLQLHGAAAVVALALGLGELALSLSHTGSYAVAHVVGISSEKNT